MIKDEAIEYLEKIEPGMFLTVNIPIYKDEIKPITVMYAGKDKEGRYNFLDSGQFILSKDFIEKGKITIDKDYNIDEVYEIYSKHIIPERHRKNSKNEKTR